MVEKSVHMHNDLHNFLNGEEEEKLLGIRKSVFSSWFVWTTGKPELINFNSQIHFRFLKEGGSFEGPSEILLSLILSEALLLAVEVKWLCPVGYASDSLPRVIRSDKQDPRIQLALLSHFQSAMF